MPTKRISQDSEPAITVALVVTRAEAEAKIQKQIEEGKSLLSRNVSDQQELATFNTDKKIWDDYNAELLARLFNTNQISKEYSAFSGGVYSMTPTFYDRVGYVTKDISKSLDRLISVQKRLELYPEPQAASHHASPSTTEDYWKRIKKILTRFHLVTRQLRHRYDSRATLDVSDEYDVQDLLHALLKVDFTDIRPEEWTPSYAGGSSRMDFLLKEEQSVIEVKKTRATLKEKQIGEQLLVDIERYKQHPDCKVLLCFIYDPEGLIGNPAGLIRDLEMQGSESLKVKVVINPA